MLKLNYFLADIFILSAEKQPIKLSWRKIEWLPASYGMTDTMGRMHSDAQFAGSSSVPAHVEMMGFLGIGNNPMVGCTVACAVDVAQALSK